MDDQKLGGCGFICLRQKKCSKISQRNRFEICEKKNSVMFKIKHDKNNISVVDQCKIAANEPNKVYIAI